MATTLTASSSALDQLEAEGGSIEMSPNEGGIPILRVDNKTSTYTDENSGLAVASFRGVVAGSFKTRILWPPEVGEEKSDPLCRSMDFQLASPNPKLFPLKESKLALTVVKEGQQVACQDCYLKEWESHPTRPNAIWCTEQVNLAVLADLEDSGTFMPYLFTTQRSGLKSVRNYLGGFMNQDVHPFTYYTEFSLDPRSRGNVEFSVPIYKRGEVTPPEEHESYAQTFLQLRAYVRRERTAEEPTPEAKKKKPKAEDLPEF